MQKGRPQHAQTEVTEGKRKQSALLSASNTAQESEHLTKTGEITSNAPQSADTRIGWGALHITITGASGLCGARTGRRLSLMDLVRFHPLTYWLMRLFGCRDCGNELRDALRHARPIV